MTELGAGFDPVKRRSLPEAVAEQLSRRLKADEFDLGQQLPGHRQLAAAFGVSVPVVREALSRLVAQGLLEIRAGQGTFVRATDGRTAAQGSFEIAAGSREELLEILEVRVMLETELGALAAERADAQQVATLSRLVEQMSVAGTDAQRFLEADMAFHVALAEAARNSVLLRVMLGLRTSMRRILDVRVMSTTATAEAVALAVERHQAIVAALADGDPAAAREAVRALMDHVAKDMAAIDEASWKSF